MPQDGTWGLALGSPYGQAGDLRGDQKVKYNQFSVTKSILKFFTPNFVCVLTNKRYKTYRMEFSFWHLGYVPGVELGVLGSTTLAWRFEMVPH